MPEEERNEEQRSDSGTSEKYASMLAQAKSQFDAKLAAMEKAHQQTVKELTDQVINGSGGTERTQDVEIEKIPSRDELYTAYRDNNFSTNIEWWKNFLDLRDATIREYGKDPTVTGSFGLTPTGEEVEPNYLEPETMDTMCSEIRKLVDECWGNPKLFNIKMNALFNH